MSAIYPNNNNTYQTVLTPQQPLIQPQPQPYYYATPLLPTTQVTCKDDKHKSDRAYSVTFFVLGFFFFFPFFFNFAYLKSPHCYARKISLASLIVGTLYLCAGFITYSIFYFTSMNCWNGSYYQYC